MEIKLGLSAVVIRFLTFAWLRMTGLFFFSISLEKCCHALDLLSVSFFFLTPHRDLIKKFLVIDRARRLGNMKVSLISLSDPYFMPLVGSLLSQGSRLLTVPTSPLQKFMDRSFGLFHNRLDRRVHAGAFIWFSSK